MNILLIHQNSPAQFRHLAPTLAAVGHRVVALTVNGPGESLPGVRIVSRQWFCPRPMCPVRPRFSDRLVVQRSWRLSRLQHPADGRNRRPSGRPVGAVGSPAAGFSPRTGSGDRAASVSVENAGRQRLECLLRYCARPAFALERLREIDAEHRVCESVKPGSVPWCSRRSKGSSVWRR